MTTRVHLISGPRNISTALMYSFRSRADTRVFDEPLYGHYLRVKPEVGHPGAEETMASMDTDGLRVIDEVLLGDYDEDVVFFKNMGHHVDDVGLPLDWLDAMVNVFLIRKPADLLTSFIKNVPDPTPEMVGMPQQVRLVERIVARGGSPIVLESDEVLADPPGVLAALCERIGIPWDPAMLSWEPGPKPEDGTWAKYWYGRLHATTGFEPPRPKDDAVPERLTATLAILEDCYATLRPYAIEAR